LALLVSGTGSAARGEDLGGGEEGPCTAGPAGRVARPGQREHPPAWP